MRHIDGMNCCMANVAIVTNILVKNLYWSNTKIENRKDKVTVQVIYYGIRMETNRKTDMTQKDIGQKSP